MEPDHSRQDRAADPQATLRAVCAGDVAPHRPVLIAGPTASGKSGLALRIARATGRCIVNADALQVFDGWRILTARPGPEDLGVARHALYGHVRADAAYSVGQWLRDVTPYLEERPAPVIVGGTGLYFSALTQGLADIPATTPEMRARATARLQSAGLAALLADLDDETRARIDRRNPMRVQRAWEVQHQTGRGLADWQDATPPPRLPLHDAHGFVLEADKGWLNDRITGRIDRMLAEGVLDEARALRPGWAPGRLSAQAIGAQDLMDHLDGRITLDKARENMALATRQYAKRQRTWFRNRLVSWLWISAPELAGDDLR